MNRVLLSFSSFLCASLLAQSPAIVGPPITAVPLTATSTEPKPIDLAICLDISGSMDGLINAARQNLWAVVNDLATLQPTPTLRVALVTFGCAAHEAEKGWVKVETDFTTDLDLVSQKLFALTTNGGEEYVARVLQAAASELQWSQRNDALKLLFVAGNESAAQDPALAFALACKNAIARGIVVNSIYCGNPADELAPAWREVAKLADGQFAAIEKDAAVVIETPFDGKLAEISGLINSTYVPYGAQREVWTGNQQAQDGNAVNLNPAAAAQRCQTKASDLYICAQWDLVDATTDPKFKLEDVKKEDLAEALRTLSLADLRAHIEGQRQKRTELRATVAELGKQRDAFVIAEQVKRSTSGDKLFETAVLEAVRQQAAARGFTRKVAASPVPTEAQVPASNQVDARFEKIVLDAAEQYRKFVRVTGDPKRAPTDCRIAPPFVRKSDAEKEHGQKLYLLYARFADGLEYVTKGTPEKVGQTLVKESWECLPGEPNGPTESSARYVSTLRMQSGENRFHAGDFHGLFVMHKLDAKTEGTDEGWVYGTVDRTGTVTAAGRVASCIQCHEDATEDRRLWLR